MKTIFEGTVNGVKYNNVNDYNKAIIAALQEGEVNASSQTKTVEEPIEQEQPKKKEVVFVGYVNDIEYNTIEEYNAAIQKVLDANESLFAWTETRTDDVVFEDEDEEDIDWLPGMSDDDYYMDSVSDDHDQSMAEIHSWEEYLNHCINIIENVAIHELDNDELNEYLDDMNDSYERIKNDYTTNTEAAQKIHNDIQSLVKVMQSLTDNQHVLGDMSQSLNNIQHKVNELESKRNVLEYASKINELFNNKYSYLLDVVNKEISARSCAECDCKCEQPAYVQNEGVRQLLNEIFSNH